MEQLKENIFSSHIFFKGLLDLVPAGVYFDSESNVKLAAHRVTNDIKNEVGDMKQCMKRAKFDPDAPQTTSELQKILPELSHAVEDNISSSPGRAQQRTRRTSESKDDVTNRKKKRKRNLSVESESDLEVPSVQSKTTSKIPACNGMVHIPSKESEVDNSTSGDVSESESTKQSWLQRQHDTETLRENLRARIAELRAKRAKGMTPEEFLESKRLRRKESKLKLKQKRKEAKQLKLSVKKQEKNSMSKLNGVSEVPPDKTKAASSKILFSKFQFSEQAKKPKEKKQDKSKSYKELYEKATQEREKIESLKQTDEEKAKKIIEKNAWKKAMEMSKGEKVKDNPELLKKSMKKEEKLKQRSQKKWQERVNTLNEQLEKRQEKRKKNIKMKKQAKTDKKIKLAKKKGRLVAGF